jgi:hypothetical protein
MAKQVGRGAKLYYGDTTGPTSFLQVPQCESIGEIGNENPQVEVTDLESTAREYLAGLADSAEIVFGFLADPLNAVHQQMDTDRRNGTVRYWKVEVYRAGSLIRTGTFQGFVKRHAWGPFTNNEATKMPMTIKLSGDVTWVP